MPCNFKRSIHFTICLILLAVCSVEAAEPVDDPSLIPAYENDSTPAWRERGYGDINNDGFEDLILSDRFSELSQNGTALFIYLGDSTGKYIAYDTTFSFMHRLSFEHVGNVTRIWNHGRSGNEVGVSCDLMSDSGLVRQGVIRLLLGGNISDDVLEATGQSDLQLHMEKYRIVDGKVEIAKD